MRIVFCSAYHAVQVLKMGVALDLRTLRIMTSERVSLRNDCGNISAGEKNRYARYIFEVCATLYVE